jgi:hypothetical protein
LVTFKQFPYADDEDAGSGSSWARRQGLVTSITQRQRATAPWTRSPTCADAGAKAAVPCNVAVGLATLHV